MPDAGPVEIDVAFQLGDDELPGQAPVALVEAEQYAAVALVARVARIAVVGAHQHLAAGHHGRA